MCCTFHYDQLASRINAMLYPHESEATGEAKLNFPQTANPRNICRPHVYMSAAFSSLMSTASAHAVDPAAGLREWMRDAPADVADHVSDSSDAGRTHSSSSSGVLECVSEAISVQRDRTVSAGTVSAGTYSAGADSWLGIGCFDVARDDRGFAVGPKHRNSVPDLGVSVSDGESLFESGG